MLVRPAATVLLVRDRADGNEPGDDGIEVLMLERRLDSGFVPGAWVFPGGALDPSDHEPAAHRITDGPHEEPASAELGIPEHGLAHRVAAVRETFEESGVLLAEHPPRTAPDPTLVERLQADRHRLEVGELTVVDLCARHDLRLRTAALRPFAHWITPEGAPRRYDTRFFLTPAPAGQLATPCGREATAAHWVTPEQVLGRAATGELPLILPTERCLRSIAAYRSTASLLAAVDDALAGAPRWVADRGGSRLDLRPTAARAREGSAA
jgi:8-oxo-dGTP pyrophosphatase MutT (NUDIX family)